MSLSTDLLLNELREAGAALLDVQRRIAEHLGDLDGSAHACRAAAHNALGGSYMRPGPPVNPEILEAFRVAEPHKWAALGRTDIQRGLMALERAVRLQ